jgi:DNA-binding NarL/FixJ family response regulator
VILPRKIRMVHLDDHTLFQKGLRICLLDLKEELILQQFQYSHHAFDAIRELILSRKILHLIITDFVHMGQHGYEFAKSVRELESASFLRIPILLLSLQSPTYNEYVVRGLRERVFDAYLPKCAPREQIHETISQLTGLEFRSAYSSHR